MSIEADMAGLKRVTFFEGQRLLAEDLTDLRLSQQELRWLHNRSLHNWGIGLGLTVTGEKGDRQVTVSPGYGTDYLGREIVLTEPLVQAIPPVASAADGTEATYYLVAYYASDADLQPSADTRQGVCPKDISGAVRLPEKPLFAWRTPDKVVPGKELILAQVWILNCQLNRPVSLAPRRNARPAQQPYIGAGSTPAGDTPWEIWIDQPTAAGVAPTVLGVKTVVDASRARFQLTPRYLAHVVGERILSQPISGLAFIPGNLMEGFARVQNPTANRFELGVLLPRNLQIGSSYILNSDGLFFDGNQRLDSQRVGQTIEALRSQLKWHVVWMGVEG